MNEGLYNPMQLLNAVRSLGATEIVNSFGNGILKHDQVALSADVRIWHSTAGYLVEKGGHSHLVATAEDAVGVALGVEIVSEARAAAVVGKRYATRTVPTAMEAAAAAMPLCLPAFRPRAGEIYCCDLFTLCAGMADASVDCILCDLPYGTTACAWDSVIPFAPMWAAFKRIIRPRGAIVLTASQPFTSALVMSNPAWFRHEWVWEKDNGSNPTLVTYQPFKVHETALVFSRETVSYYPQFASGVPYIAVSGGGKREGIQYDLSGHKTENNGTRYPRSVIRFNTERGYHPTQKSTDFFEYLIRTYTQPGELVFDPCVGSGTTALAAKLSGRAFICGDQDAGYVEIARQRVAGVYGVREIVTQADLFAAAA